MSKQTLLAETRGIAPSARVWQALNAGHALGVHAEFKCIRHDQAVGPGRPEVAHRRAHSLQYMPPYTGSLTFPGRSCPSEDSSSRRSTRPIWVDVLIALLILELLRAVGTCLRRLVAKRYTRKRHQSGGPPPREVPLPGETPAQFHAPSAPPAPFGTAVEQPTLTPSPSERRHLPFYPRPVRDVHVPVQYKQEPEDPRPNTSWTQLRRKLDLGDVCRLMISFDPPPRQQ